MTVLAGTGLPHNGIGIRLPPTMPTSPPELTWILRSLFSCHCMPPTADGGDTITGYRFPRKRGSEDAANGGDDDRAAGGDGGSAPYRRRAAGGGRMGGRCAPRHLAQAGSNAGDIGRPADEIRRKAVMFSSFHLSLHRCPGGRPAHGGISSEPPVSGNCTEEDDAAPPVRRAAGGGGVPESGLITLPETPLNFAGQQRERAPSRDEATAQGGHRSPVPST